MQPIRFVGTACVLVLACAALVHATEEFHPVRRQPAAEAAPVGAQRIIVKLRAVSASERIQAQAATNSVTALAQRTRLTLKRARPIVDGLHVMQVEPEIPGEPISITLERLRADPAVEFAEVDQRRYPHAMPNDTLFNGQWYLQAGQAAAVNAVGAWDITTGGSGVVIAVLDTGVRFDHPDLRASGANRLLPGYDFVSGDSSTSFLTANDGDGRDADASDPGDWVTSQETLGTEFNGCEVSDSSWHGTRLAGILGALTNNSVGIAGLTWSGWILPVRVLGKCGGYDSDILDAMRWAAGLHVEGVPDNEYPAKIENLSLGGAGACPRAYQDVIDEVSAAGVLIVVSAGNDGGPVSAPANCARVAGIAGLRHAGTKVGYSSLGPQIALSAPAGNCVNTTAGSPCLYSIDTTVNSGVTTPASSTYTDQTNSNVGTSFSAPIVAGIGALMSSVNGNLNAAQLIARLQEGTRPFPTTSDTGTPAPCHVPINANDIQDSECACTTQTCGAGMADAEGAVLAALRPIAAVTLPATVAAGQNVTLDASASAAACGHSVSAYSWTTVSGGNPTGISGATSATATVVAPATGTYTARVTVTDDTGKTDAADVVLTSGAATTSAPSSAGTQACPKEVSFTLASSSSGSDTGSAARNSGGGGGGTFDVLTLLLVVLLGRLQDRRRSFCAAQLTSTGTPIT